MQIQNSESELFQALPESVGPLYSVQVGTRGITSHALPYSTVQDDSIRIVKQNARFELKLSIRNFRGNLALLKAKIVF